MRAVSIQTFSHKVEVEPDVNVGKRAWEMVLRLKGTGQPRSRKKTCLMPWGCAGKQHSQCSWNGKVGRSSSSSSRMVNNEGFVQETLSRPPASTALRTEERRAATLGKQR